SAVCSGTAHDRHRRAAAGGGVLPAPGPYPRDAHGDGATALAAVPGSFRQGGRPGRRRRRWTAAGRGGRRRGGGQRGGRTGRDGDAVRPGAARRGPATRRPDGPLWTDLLRATPAKRSGARSARRGDGVVLAGAAVRRAVRRGACHLGLSGGAVAAPLGR